MMKRLALVMGFCGLLSAKAQQIIPGIDVQHYTFKISVNDQNDTIKGQATVKIRFTSDIKDFSLNLVKPGKGGKGMLVSSVTSGKKMIGFSQDSDALVIDAPAKAGSVRSFVINYSGIPADGLIISTNKFGHRTFFGDNWPNRAHNWLPCADYPSDKATVDFVVNAPDHYRVVSNGLETEEKELSNHFKLTHWKESVPLPTKVMVIGVADFAIDTVATIGKIPVYTYVFPENEQVGFKSYAVAREILPYYIKMFGPYAFEKLADVQSKTIFGGMENAGCIFYFENSVDSPGIEELMAHEIAHQWFGDAASEQSFAHLWLSEGFATYLTNLYLEHKYGADTLKERMEKDRETVFRFERRRLSPVVDTAIKTNFMRLLNPNSYQKGSWVLHMLRRRLGDSIFRKGLRKYYARYDGGNATTSDFEKVMEQTSGQNLAQFFRQWLYTAGHPKLSITWKYDSAKQKVSLTVTQLQQNLYDLPLQIAVDGQLHTIQLSQKTTSITFHAATKPEHVVADPDVNLLAAFTVTEAD